VTVSSSPSMAIDVTRVSMPATVLRRDVVRRRRGCSGASSGADVG
jgi:hypothetical protein